MSSDNKEASDSTEDRITKVPDGLSRGSAARGEAPRASGKKEKDPKKVAAGKALAEKNKKAREALKREEEREAAGQRPDEKEQGESAGDGSSWTQEISFSNVLTVIGIGLTIVSFYREIRGRQPPSTPAPAPPVSLSEAGARSALHSTSGVDPPCLRGSATEVRNKMGMD